MLSKRSITSTFHLFPKYMLSSLYDTNTDIEGVEVESDSIQAVNFKADLKTTIYYQNDEIIAMTCHCGREEYCSHIVELIGYLYRNYDQVSSGGSTIPSSRSKLFQARLEPGNKNKYRKVLDTDTLLTDREDPEEAPSNDNNFYEVYSDQEGLLCIDIAKSIFRNSDQTTGIRFKWRKKSLYVKCSRCTDLSERLCEHQSQALLYVDIPVIQKFILGKISIRKQYEHLASEFNIPYAILKEHFWVYFTEDGSVKGYVELKAKGNTHIILPSNIKSILSDHGIFNNDMEEHNLILDEIYDQNGEIEGNAIVWAINNHDQMLIKYVQGKLSKNKKKLTSHFTEIEKPAITSATPHGIPHAVQTDLMRYDMVDAALNLTGVPIRLQQHLEFLQKNAESWNDHIHYLHIESYSRNDKIKKSNLNLFEFTDEQIQLDLEVSVESEIIKVHVAIDPLVHLSESEWSNSYQHPLFYTIGNKAFLFKHISVLQFIRRFGFQMKYIFSDEEQELTGKFISDLVNKYHIGINHLEKKLYKTIPVSRCVIRISQHNQRICFEPIIEGNDQEQFHILSKFSHAAQTGSHFIEVPEQDAAEDILSWLRDLHDDMDTMTGMLGYYSMPIDAFRKDLWFLEFKEKCEKADVELAGWDQMEGFSFNLNRARIIQEIDTEMDWFDIRFTIRYGDILVPQKDWIWAIKNEEKYVLLEDGTYGIIPEEWRLKMTRLLCTAKVNKDTIQLSKLHFNVVDQFVDLNKEPQLQQNIEEIKDRLLHFQGVESFDVPETITASLRPYQKEGFHWLKFLNKYGFGGCLADDMGLGKTLQVISLLANQKSLDPLTNLVVVPRSLMYNWAAEIEKFCPAMTYLIHHGTTRSKDCKEFQDYDLIISTYGTVAQDIDYLRDFPFHYTILDESQAIKNPSSKRYRAMTQLKSSYKLTMTGTPVENSTMDLYAQFNFINPGLLGSKRRFRKQFSDPIDKDRDAKATELLHKIIHPFLLRRTKDQVAQDLPPRTESILYCEMENTQKELYHKMKNEIRASLLDQENLEQNKIKVLDGLLKLRQICNSPALLKGKDRSMENGIHPSVKIDTLMEQIEEVVLQEKHSILVFSQFTSMLALVKEQLDKNKITYAYLDGSTNNRQSVIEAFNGDIENRIFLISLKSGNTGLNLTKADFVYLLDPWWNPAVESQAIDRTHRIGQTKPVFAYRFICKDTIEEKIMKLQSKKTQIADDLIKTDENVFKSLDKEALIKLFE